MPVFGTKTVRSFYGSAMFNLWLHLTFLYIVVSRPSHSEKEVYPYDSEQAPKNCLSVLQVLKENDQNSLKQIYIDNKNVFAFHHTQKKEKYAELLLLLKFKVSEFFHDQFGLNYL